MADNNTTFNPTSAAAVSAGGSLLGSVVGSISQAIQNKKTREFNQAEAEKQRQWNEEMYNKQNAWNLEMWNKTNEYNAPISQVNRLREAGLNPLFYGLDGSSAGTMSAASPLGYERAQADNQPNPFGNLSQDIVKAGQLSMQGQSLAKDIELKNAQIDKLKEDSRGVKLDNDWKDKTMAARTDAEDLKNSLTKKQISEADSRIEKNKQDVKESIARTDNEIEKKGLIIAEKALTEAKAKEILEMLPFNKLLVQAQTEAQKAAAAVSWANAAIQQGLFDAGYVDKTIDDLAASIRQKETGADSVEVTKAINELKLAIKSGTVFDGIAPEGSINNFLLELTGRFFAVLSVASESIGSGFSGVFK